MIGIILTWSPLWSASYWPDHHCDRLHIDLITTVIGLLCPDHLCDRHARFHSTLVCVVHLTRTFLLAVSYCLLVNPFANGEPRSYAGSQNSSTFTRSLYWLNTSYSTISNTYIISLCAYVYTVAPLNDTIKFTKNRLHILWLNGFLPVDLCPS